MCTLVCMQVWNACTCWRKKTKNVCWHFFAFINNDDVNFREKCKHFVTAFWIFRGKKCLPYYGIIGNPSWNYRDQFLESTFFELLYTNTGIFSLHSSLLLYRKCLPSSARVVFMSNENGFVRNLSQVFVHKIRKFFFAAIPVYALACCHWRGWGQKKNVYKMCKSLMGTYFLV